MPNPTPHLKFEQEIWDRGMLAVGIDEVGRGSFAGPLVTCAVVLRALSLKDCKWILQFGINDSKLLSTKKRLVVKKYAQEFILFSSIQSIPVSTINEKGVGFANKLGFEKAAYAARVALKSNKLIYLTDAFPVPGIPLLQQKNIIRGDSTSISIALASIVAKIERDNFMEQQAIGHPQYGFEKHKGYGTLYHRNKIKEYGPCSLHRTQFIQGYISHT